MEIRLATNSDLAYILNLAKSETNAIGFIPKSRYEQILNSPSSGTIHVVSENKMPVGFVYASHFRHITKIQQIAIQEDARKMQRAKALVDACTLPNDMYINLRCAEGLESNLFWRAIGFSHKMSLATENTRGRKINVYSKMVGGLFYNFHTGASK